MLVYAVVFGVYGFERLAGGRASGGGVHVLHKVLVVGWIGPEMLLRCVVVMGLSACFGDTAVGPEEECAICQRCESADYGAADGRDVEGVGA